MVFAFRGGPWHVALRRIRQARPWIRLSREQATSGTDAENPALEAVVLKARRMLAEWLKVDIVEQGVQHWQLASSPKGLRTWMWTFPKWLSGFTPVEFEVPIEPGGYLSLGR